MLSWLTSVLKIVLGSLIAQYFASPFAGGWWAGALLLISSFSGICSFTGFMLLLNVILNFISLLSSLFAIVGDSMLADYFSFYFPKCNFDENESACFCDKVKTQYDALIYYIGDAKCDNVFARNPQLLIINAVLSAVCFLTALILFVLLSIALGFTFWNRRKEAVRDFTITV